MTRRDPWSGSRRVPAGLATLVILLLTLCVGSVHAEKTSGPPGSKTVLALLSDKDRDAVLTALAGEIDSYRRGTTAAEAMKNRAQKELLRDLDRNNQRSSRRDSPEAKALAELLADLDRPEAPWQRKVLNKSADLVYQVAIGDPKRFAEVAGEISAGEYGQVRNTLSAATASLLAKAIGELLEAGGYAQSKEVWDALSANAKDLLPLGKAVLRGTSAEVVKELRTLGTKQLKEASKSAIADTVGWVFGPLGGAAGKGYVKVLESEVDFLAWSKRTLDRSTTRTCLTRYTSEYARVSAQGTAPDGAAVVAYDEFKQCSEERGLAVGFRALEDFIRENGLDADAIYRQMAEDYRNGQFQFADQWLAQQLEARKRKAESQLERDLAAAEVRLDALRLRFNQALTTVLNGLIDAVVAEDQLAELEAEGARALLDSFPDQQLLGRVHDGALGACAAFRAAATEARRLIDDARRLQEEAEALGIRLSNPPDCGGEAAEAKALADLLARGKAALAEFKREAGKADAATTASCTASEAITGSGSKAAEKAAFERTTAAAGEAERAIAAAKAAAKTLGVAIREERALSVADTRAARDQLSDLIADAQLNQLSVAPLTSRLAAVLARLKSAKRTAENLEGVAQDQAKKIRTRLEPERGGPLRDEIQAVEDRVERALTEIADCRAEIVDQFDREQDGALPLRLAKVEHRLSDELSDRITAARTRCPETPDADPAALRRTLEELAQGVGDELGILDLAAATYGKCVAQATTGYDQTRQAADAVLRRVAVEPDPAYQGWTVTDGSARMQLYEGDYRAVGTYTWTAPPANIGPDGADVTLNVTAEAGPKQGGGLATGIGISVEGADLMNSASDRRRSDGQAPANAKAGQSTSNSITVRIVPRPGQAAKIRIGAFWGLGVTYRYEPVKP